MLFLAIVVLGGLYSLLISMNIATAELQRKREDATTLALNRAKEALIGYAITYSDTHPNEVMGYLPCPDDGTASQEGAAALNCGSARVSQLGRLPWATLDLGPLRDSDGQCLWYAVSGTYKYNPKSNLMNWDTTGQFEVVGPDGVTLLAGSPAANRAVAVIFAPGAPRSGQNRSATAGTLCGGDYANAAAYLDAAAGVNNATVSSTADAITRFIAANATDPAGTFTDRLVFITADDIWTAAKKRTDLLARLQATTQKVADCLAQAANANAPGDLRMPGPATMSVSAAIDDYYRLNNMDDLPTLLAGHAPYRLDTAPSGSLGFGVTNIFGLSCLAAPRDQNWYENWKDHFLYVVADEFKPSAAATNACASTCLTVDGTGTYAALVLFAGQRTAGQQRDTPANKDSIANYLEAPNAARFQDRYAGATVPFNYTKIASTTYPELAYCIRPSTSPPQQIASPCP